MNKNVVVGIFLRNFQVHKTKKDLKLVAEGMEGLGISINRLTIKNGERFQS